MSLIKGLTKLIVVSWNGFNKLCEWLQPVGDLFIRCWLAKAFIASGLTKILSWQSTLVLFNYEYMVPYLSPAIAASISVIIEIGVSIFMLIGLGGRVPAFILFVFNIMAVISYPVLRMSAGYVGLKDHICWGLLLLVLVLHGSGKLSLDEIVIWWYKRRHK